jgi:hypothetical protein
MPSTCQDNGTTRDESTKETSSLKILLIFCGLKRLNKLVFTYHKFWGQLPSPPQSMPTHLKHDVSGGKVRGGQIPPLLKIVRPHQTNNPCNIPPPLSPSLHHCCCHHCYHCCFHHRHPFYLIVFCVFCHLLENVQKTQEKRAGKTRACAVSHGQIRHRMCLVNRQDRGLSCVS